VNQKTGSGSCRFLFFGSQIIYRFFSMIFGKISPLGLILW
jgi:hypothetical protein